MPGKSTKGFSFERKICKDLSKWFNNDNAFWRSPASGGWARKNKLRSGPGDIMATCPESEVLTKDIVWEIKRGYSEQDSVSKLLSDNSKIINFISGLETLIKESGKRFGILIYKADYRDTLVFIPHKLSKNLNTPKKLLLTHPKLEERYCIFYWEEFLETDPESFLINLPK